MSQPERECQTPSQDPVLPFQTQKTDFFRGISSLSTSLSTTPSEFTGKENRNIQRKKQNEDALLIQLLAKRKGFTPTAVPQLRVDRPVLSQLYDPEAPKSKARRRHKITRKTSLQLKALERAYKLCKGEWTPEIVEQVSNESGLLPTQVYKWGWD